MASAGEDRNGLDEALHRVLVGGEAHRPPGYDPLDATVAACLGSIPAVEAAAISYVRAGRVRSTHCTDPAIAEIDGRHNEAGRGPLFDEAITQPWPRSFIAIEDLASAAVWGASSPLEIAPPFRSLVSITLRSTPRGRTALDLYARAPQAFDLDTTMVVDMFAVRAAHLLYGPVDPAKSRYALAVETISRRLRLDRPNAERLLLTHLEPLADPVAVAERLTRHADGAETTESD
ncbi:hypothetical protein LQ327_25045 [Actinomycetospora endophytica]|uniref:ANTAR domain-containing protein n=1 Tax=Actinomycetospora endophytica TaxID=2291215 RepID=A0ABS8PEE5_9PSEU|nr:hypothetical protein [Actinomycetospora endophytica]MCD2196645.1 hypothetical protein [Actinomycetospora endophytica]